MRSTWKIVLDDVDLDDELDRLNAKAFQHGKKTPKIANINGENYRRCNRCLHYLPEDRFRPRNEQGYECFDATCRACTPKVLKEYRRSISRIEEVMAGDPNILPMGARPIQLAKES